MQISEDEQHTIAAALYTAIEKYSDCIRAFDQSVFPPEAKARLVDQFDRQIKACRDILIRIEE